MMKKRSPLPDIPWDGDPNRDPDPVFGFVPVSGPSSDGTRFLNLTSDVKDLLSPEAIVVGRLEPNDDDKQDRWSQSPVFHAAIAALRKITDTKCQPHETCVLFGNDRRSAHVYAAPVCKPTAAALAVLAQERKRMRIDNNLSSTAWELVNEDKRFYILTGKRAENFFPGASRVLCYDEKRPARIAKNEARPKRRPKIRKVSSYAHVRPLARALRDIVHQRFGIKIEMEPTGCDQNEIVQSIGGTIKFMKSLHWDEKRLRKLLGAALRKHAMATTLGYGHSGELGGIKDFWGEFAAYIKNIKPKETETLTLTYKKHVAALERMTKDGKG